MSKEYDILETVEMLIGFKDTEYFAKLNYEDQEVFKKHSIGLLHLIDNNIPMWLSGAENLLKLQTMWSGEEEQIVVHSLRNKLLSINASGELSDSAIQRSYDSVVAKLQPPTRRGWFIFGTDTCPQCGTDLYSEMIQEIFHGSESIGTHWRFFYYNCPKCNYEWGKWV